MKIGDTAIAYRNVSDLIEPAIEFYEGECYDVCGITEHSIVLENKWEGEVFFAKSCRSRGDFIGDFFE